MLGKLARTLATLAAVLTVPVLSVSFIQPVNAATVAPADAAAVQPLTVTEPLSPKEMHAKECSACHLAFPAGFLPKRSWTAIMADLTNHFGEDASLPPASVAAIEGYLLENAGDAGKKPNNWVRRIPAKETPLRISELKLFMGIHGGEVSPAAFKKAGSKANCTFCHRQAEQGSFGE
jgi:hypothetical protein